MAKQKSKFSESPLMEGDGTQQISVKWIITWQIWECIKAGNKMYLSPTYFIFYKSAVEQLEAVSTIKLKEKYYTERDKVLKEFDKAIRECGGKINAKIKRSTLNKEMELKIDFLERQKAIRHFRLIVEQLKKGGFLDEEEITETPI
jgi:hypothetical protein